jgi:hypothetical protein
MEKKKTMIFGGVAIVLMLLAFITTPRTKTPDAFLDQGELFFANFTDPNEAQIMEVIDWDEETGEALPFKVVFAGGKWSIPSHNDYPADGQDRLSKTAAGVIDIKKDDFRTDNPVEHEACGVIDPLDETETSLTGRGKRVTLKAENDKVLADFIIGKEIEGRDNFRFVRVPGQKRVYAVRMDIDISTTFSDWIEADLLKVNKDDITQVILKDYSVNERTGTVNQRDVLMLGKDGDIWRADRMAATQEVDDTKMKDLLTKIDELNIVGVRPKPAGLSKTLSRGNEEGGMQVSQSDMMSLQSKGYFFSRNGQLLSNEGEAQVRTKDGLTYTLRFGEVVYGSGIDVSAGSEANQNSEAGPGENRYLFITTEFDAKQFPEPPKPADLSYQTKADSLWTTEDRSNKKMQDEYSIWESNIKKGQDLSIELNDRFAGWYYVISSESFDKINLKRTDLVKKREAEETTS